MAKYYNILRQKNQEDWLLPNTVLNWNLHESDDTVVNDYLNSVSNLTTLLWTMHKRSTHNKINYLHDKSFFLVEENTSISLLVKNFQNFEKRNIKYASWVIHPHFLGQKSMVFFRYGEHLIYWSKTLWYHFLRFETVNQQMATSKRTCGIEKLASVALTEFYK